MERVYLYLYSGDGVRREARRGEKGGGVCVREKANDCDAMLQCNAMRACMLPPWVGFVNLSHIRTVK